MNVIHDPSGMRPPGPSHPVALDDTSGQPGWQPAQRYGLRRSGRKPVRFDGWQLVEAVGSAGRQQVWYDLNIFRTTDGQTVVELTTRREAAGEPDLCRVKTFEDLDAAAGWLETFRCADDVPIPAGLFAVDTPLPWVVLQAVQLRQRLERIEAEYHALLNEVFVALDLGDPVGAASNHDRPNGVDAGRDIVSSLQRTRLEA